MSGKVYSDFLYRNHLCRSFAIPAAWKEDSGTVSNTSRPVKAIDYERLTAEQFFNDYERPNIPLLIRGAASTTRAFQYWKNPDYLLRTQQQQQQQEEKGKDVTTSSSSSSSSLQDTAKTKTTTTTPSLLFRATSGAAPLPANFSLSSYLNYCQSFDYWEESPLYLFDRNAFLDPNHPWSKDFFDEFYQNCPYWNVNNNNDKKNYGHDLLQYLGSNEKRPDHTWIIMGPKRSGSVFHLDPNATHAWNVSLKGRKRWIFYPPGVAPPGVHPSEDGDEVALPISVGEWILQYWQEHVERSSSNKTTTPIHERPYECTAHPGDAIFVPHGWWHMVINLDGDNNNNGDSGDYNLAMTHNYVSPSNLGNVLKFFKYKQDQISGCRDRIETIKPEYLHDAFVSALQDERNNVPPQFLQQAQEQKGWTCKAFETTATTTTTNHNNNNNTNNNKKMMKKKRKRGETTTTSSTGEDNDGDNNNNNKQQEDGTSETAESTNNNNNNSVMAKANTCSTPFSFSFL